MRRTGIVVFCAGVVVAFALSGCQAGEGGVSYSFRADGSVVVATQTIDECRPWSAEDARDESVFGEDVVDAKGYRLVYRAHKASYRSVETATFADVKVTERTTTSGRTIRLEIPVGREARWWRFVAPPTDAVAHFESASVSFGAAESRTHHVVGGDSRPESNPTSSRGASASVVIHVDLEGGRCAGDRREGDGTTALRKNEDDDVSTLRFDFRRFRLEEPGVLVWETDWTLSK
jgi:hypothetical protein